MPPSTVTVKGLRELNDALAELSRGIAKNVLRGSVRAAAAVIRDEAKLKAPRRSGQLRRSLYVKHIPENSSATRQVFYVSARRGKKKAESKKGSGNAAYYAKFIEYGHFTRPAGKHKNKFGREIANRLPKHTDVGQVNNAALADAVQAGTVHWVPAQPFLRPAWDGKKRDALTALQDYLRKRIPLEAAKARRK